MEDLNRNPKVPTGCVTPETIVPDLADCEISVVVVATDKAIVDDAL
jgi:hypothetical protein